MGKRSCSSSPGGIREDCGPAVQGAAKMVDKASRKRAGEELAPAPKRQRQEQQGPRLIEAALPPPLQMGFVHGGSECAFLLSIEHTKICKKILGPQAHNKYIYVYIIFLTKAPFPASLSVWRGPHRIGLLGKPPASAAFVTFKSQ